LNGIINPRHGCYIYLSYKYLWTSYTSNKVAFLKGMLSIYIYKIKKYLFTLIKNNTEKTELIF